MRAYNTAMLVNDDEIVAGERIILSRPANVVIARAEFGLPRFRHDHLLRLVGFADHEAVGGRLYLTTYRVLFAAHVFNRVTGRFSIPLPAIVDLRDVSRLLVKQVVIITPERPFVFVVRRAPALIAAIQAASADLSSEQAAYLRERVPGGTSAWTVG